MMLSFSIDCLRDENLQYDFIFYYTLFQLDNSWQKFNLHFYARDHLFNKQQDAVSTLLDRCTYIIMHMYICMTIYGYCSGYSFDSKSSCYGKITNLVIQCVDHINTKWHALYYKIFMVHFYGTKHVISCYYFVSCYMYY